MDGIKLTLNDYSFQCQIHMSKHSTHELKVLNNSTCAQQWKFPTFELNWFIAFVIPYFQYTFITVVKGVIKIWSMII